MNQIAIDFAEPRPFKTYQTVQTPAARRSDPETSHEAAEHITKGGIRAAQQSRCIAAIRAFPGKTMQELSELTGICRFELGRRVSECELAGAVRRLPKRKCEVSGRMAEPWTAADAR